jgi:hypothetical protein
MCDHLQDVGNDLTLLDKKSRREFIRLSTAAGLGVAAGPAFFPRRGYGEPVSSSFRTTRGIVSDTADSDPGKEADVMMTAVTLGLAASYIAETGKGMRFDAEPKADNSDLNALNATVTKMDRAIKAYFLKKGKIASQTVAGEAPRYDKGAVIMGVYKMAGQTAPNQVFAPVLSDQGKRLWQRIYAKKVDYLYVGRGAYTGFVDNPAGDPIGPLSTVRTSVQTASYGVPPTVAPMSRWKPPMTVKDRGGKDTMNPLWQSRLITTGKYVPWGMIMPKGSTAAADWSNFSVAMQVAGMRFVPSVVNSDDIAMYTHGMIQAIYKAYNLGPKCEPYEIATGDETTKMASCLTCTLFMYANGYPPNSIHLGRGESWAPLYAAYSPDMSKPTRGEDATVRDLNHQWYRKCTEWMTLGLEILEDSQIVPEYKKSRDAVKVFLAANRNNPTVGGGLVLDAVTIHESETVRIGRTLKQTT